MNNASLASDYATDTVALVLWLEKRQLGAPAQAVFITAEAGQTVIHIPAMVIAESLYLSEKGRISVAPVDAAQQVQSFPQYRECPMNLAVIETAAQITDIRELPDRLIAATARWLNVALLTNGSVIERAAFVTTVW